MKRPGSGSRDPTAPAPVLAARCVPGHLNGGLVVSASVLPSGSQGRRRDRRSPSPRWVTLWNCQDHLAFSLALTCSEFS